MLTQSKDLHHITSVSEYFTLLTLLHPLICLICAKDMMMCVVIENHGKRWGAGATRNCEG